MYRLRLFLHTHTLMERDSICKRSDTKDIKFVKIRECGGVHFKSSQKNRQRRKEINREKKSTRRERQRIQRLAHKKKEKETHKTRKGQGKINSEIKGKQKAV